MFASCYDFGSGAKLMEHSWVGNQFVSFIEKQLVNNPQPIVWAGDYADNEEFESLTKLAQDAIIKVAIQDNKKYGEKYKKDYLEDVKKEGANLYSIATSLNNKLTHDIDIPDGQSKYDFDFGRLPSRYKYLVNHDKKTFVDKSKTPKVGSWQIHALPLLTCEGNGRGGGDFRGESELIGSWSRNVIEVVSKKSEIPKGFTELAFDLKED